MSILYRNGARLFEPGRGGPSAGSPEFVANTQFLCHFQPKLPWAAAASKELRDDESGNAFDPNTVRPSVAASGQVGPGPIPGTYAAYFDGATDWNTGNQAALTILGDLTIEAWVRPTTSGTTRTIIVYGAAGETEATNAPYWLYLSTNDKIVYEHEAGAGANHGVEWDVILDENRWYYIAIVRDDTASEVRCYVDGVRQRSGTAGGGGSVTDGVFSYPASPTGGNGAGNGLFIGALWGPSQRFTGYMAGLRLMDAARSQADIEGTWKRINPNDPDNLRTPDLLPEVDPSTHANVTLYVEAPQHDVDDGDTVTTPTSIVGGAVTQATAAERPYIVTASGAPGWKMFDDVSQGKWFDGPNVNTLIQLSPVRYHAFCVFTMYGADQNSGSLWTNHRLFGDDAGWWGAYALQETGSGNIHNQVYGYHWDGSAKVARVEPILRHQIHLLEMWYDEGTGELVTRVDDGAEVRVAAGNIGGSGALEIGGNSTDEFHGVIHSLMIANDFDAARQQGIRNHFANKYRVRV